MSDEGWDAGSKSGSSGYQDGQSYRGGDQSDYRNSGRQNHRENRSSNDDYNGRYGKERSYGGGREGGRDDSQRYGRSQGRFSEVMEIDSGDVGKIIGRGGSNVKEVQSMFSVHVNVDKNSDYGGNTNVSVSGDDQRSVDDAIRHMKDQLSDTSRGRGGDGGYRKDFRRN